MKRVIVLGSTGSIGVQALEVIGASEELRVVGLSCWSQAALLLEQAAAAGCHDVAIGDDWVAATVEGELRGSLELRHGPSAAAQLVREVDCDVVLNAIVGFAGLEATVAALENGRFLALANKESLVCAGTMVRALTAKHEARILPVDSEHSALYQLMAAAGRQAVEAVVITGSGGPFHGKTLDYLSTVSREQALTHPTWTMGEKITVDSATLMNKGLEVIEAHHLFEMPYERIEVVIHPQSIVHSLVRMVDGALLAHLGVPDMRVPIAYALQYPERTPVPTTPLDLVGGVSLEFGAPDEHTFPSLSLAREAGRRGDKSTCALNAANEVAVRAFLDGGISFPGIWEVIDEVMQESEEGEVGTYQEAVRVDGWARSRASVACAQRRLTRARG